MKSLIAQSITSLRKEKGLTQNQLAQKINYSYKAVSKWETGEVVPSVDVLQKLAEVFGVSLSKMLGEEQPQKAVETEVKKVKNRKKYFYISMFAISLTWIVLTIVSVVLSLVFNNMFYIILLWGFPLTFVLAIVFNALWGKGFYNYIYISLLVWGLLICLCLQFYYLDIWTILYIGIPAQLATVFGIMLFNKVKKIEK